MCITRAAVALREHAFASPFSVKGEGRVRVSVANQAMQNTPHLNPLPSTEGRGEAWIFREAHARRQHAIIVIIISILAMAARLILINQPYVDHWSWRQSDVAAISRFFCKTDFVSAIRKLLTGRTPSTPTATTCLFCGDYSAAACDLVLARASNCTGILSHHFFGAGGIGIESFWWYWQIAQQNLVSSLTPALSALALVGLFVPQSRDRRCSRVFHWWLARRYCFHHDSRLRQPPPLVSTSVGTDRRRVCKRRLRAC